jgi:hypothetical protein
VTMKPSKTQKAKSLDKLGRHLPSKPAAAVDSLGTLPVPRELITASGQRSLAAADRISASNRGGVSGGNPLVSILKPPTPVTFRPGIPHFLGRLKSTSFEVASPEVSPCASPCRVSPWGLATPWLSPSPTLLSEGPPSHM